MKVWTIGFTLATFVAVAPIVPLLVPFIVLGVFIGSHEWLSRRAKMP